MVRTKSKPARGWRTGWNRLIASLALVLAGGLTSRAVETELAADPGPATFQHLAQVTQWLAANSAETNVRVDFNGVVLGVFPELDLVIMQDATGNAGLQLDLPRFAGLKVGQRIHLAGCCRLGSGVASLRPAELIDNDGTHPAQTATGQMFLTRGRHPFWLTYFQAVRQQTLKLEYAGPHFKWMPVPAAALSHVANPAGPEPRYEPGVTVDYYAGNWDGLPDFRAMTPLGSGLASTISLAARRRDDHYALRFQGCLTIDEPGNYVFRLTSDDGSQFGLQNIPTTVEVLAEKEPRPAGAAREIAIGQALPKGQDYSLAVCQGEVSFISRAGQGWALELNSDGGQMQVLLSHCARLPPGLVNEGLLRATGYCQSIMDEHGRLIPGTLLVASAADLSVVKIAPDTTTPWASLSGSYQTVLQGGVFANHNATWTLVLRSLTIGHQHAVQLWANDSRKYGRGRTEVIRDEDGGTVTLAYNTTGKNGGVGQSAIGTFTATATNRVLTLTGDAPADNNSAQINALQVRDLGPSTGSNHWNPPVNITGDQDVATNGRLLYACSCAATATRVNTVPFAPGFDPSVMISGAAGSIADGFRQNPGSNLPLLTSAAQVQHLKPEEAARAYPVRLRGLLTARQVGPEGIMQDLTSAVYVRFNLPKGQPMVTGNSYEIAGVTSPGNYAPIVIASEATELGPRPFPVPLHPDFNQLRDGSLDCQWVELQGLLAEFNREAREARLIVKGGTVRIFFLFNADLGLLEPLGKAFVRIRGCVVPAKTASGKPAGEASLWMPSLAGLTVDQVPAADPFAVPLKAIADFSQFDPNPGYYQLTRVRGQLLHVAGEVVYFTDGSQVARLFPKLPCALAAGDLVEAVGLPESSAPSASLIEATLKKIGRGDLPAPQLVTFEQALLPTFDARWIKLEGRLVDYRMDQSRLLLDLESGLRHLQAETPVTEPLPELPPRGSLVALRGVITEWPGGKAGAPGNAELLLNAPADLTVLEYPPFWTQRRALWAIGLLVSTVSLAGLWIYFLQRTVARRTRALQLEMNERQSAEEKVRGLQTQRALEEQRARIARNIHDDLGARATKLSLLADQPPASPFEAPAHQATLAATARQIVQALDETVWAVNPRNDSVLRLASYIVHFTRDLFQSTGIHCRLDIPELPELAITAEFRFNVFLMVKETLHNVLKHSQATHLVLQLRIAGSRLHLTMRDDGRGFDPATLTRRNGLDNLKTRVAELGGQITIASAPGAGTTIALDVPLADHPVATAE